MISKILILLIYAYCFSLPIQKSFIIPGIGSFNKLISIALIIVFLFKIILSNSKINYSKFYIIGYAFLLLNFFGILFAKYQYLALEKSWLLFQLITLSLIIFSASRLIKKIENLLYAFLIGSCYLIYLMIFEFNNFYMNNSSRIYIENYNPNEVAFLLSVALVFSIYLSLDKTKILFVLTPLFIFGIFLTGSRNGLILVLLILTSFLIFLVLKKGLKDKFIIPLIIVLVSFAIYLLPEPIKVRLLSIGDEFTASSGLSGRSYIWQASVEVIKDNFLFGVGPGNFKMYSGEYLSSNLNLSAHNVFISIFSENGFIGLLVFLLIVFTLVKEVINTNQKNSNVVWFTITLLITWIVFSMGSHSEVQKITWLIFTVILIFTRNNSRLEKKFES